VASTTKRSILKRINSSHRIRKRKIKEMAKWKVES
jgi:hypothetical protein